MNTHKYLLLALFVAGLEAGFHESTATASGGIRTIALTGDLVPGLGSQDSFVKFSTPSLNERGEIAFRANLSVQGSGTTQSQALVKITKGNQLQVLARTGDAVPETDGLVRHGASFGIPVINESGQVAFVAELTGDRLIWPDGTGGLSYNPRGVFSEGSGEGLALVARTWEKVSGVGQNLSYGRFTNPILNDDGQTAFNATLIHTLSRRTHGHAIYFGNISSDVTLVVSTLDGSLDAGFPPNKIYEQKPTILSNGQIAFENYIPGGSLIGANNTQFLSRAIGGQLSPIVTPGDVAHVRDAVFTLDSLHWPSFNSSGQVAFLGIEDGNGTVGFPKAKGIFLAGTDTQPELVALSGDLAPGAGSGVEFKFFFGPQLNRRGDTLFTAGLIGPGIQLEDGVRGVFSGGDTRGLRMIARDGGGRARN